MSEIKITVQGPVGSGKSALLGEIEILCKALGVPVRYADPSDAASEKSMTHADWTAYLEMYKPSVVLHEKGPDRAALASTPVAGETVTWEAVRQELAIFLMGATGRSSKEWHRPLDNASEGGALAKMRACLAAPQASAEDVRNGTASKRYSDIDFDGWIAMHCDCDDLTAYERKLARDAWDAAMASHQGEPVDLPRIDADRLRAIAASGSQTAMSNALLNVARALKTQADKDGGQQRAGDELTHLRAENQRLRNGVDQDIAEVDRLQALYDSEWRKCKKLRAAFDHPVFAFLLGEGQLHGVDFGERAPGAVGKWWWRKDLRAALSAPQAEQGERDA